MSGPAHVARLLLCAGPGLAAACVHYTAATQPGLSAAVQGAAWALFLASVPASLLATRPFYLERSPFLCLALLSSYNLLSLSYEVSSRINKFSPRLQSKCKCTQMGHFKSVNMTQYPDNIEINKLLKAIFLPVLCLAMAFWSNMEDTQSQYLYKKDDYFGSFLRNNREKVD